MKTPPKIIIETFLPWLVVNVDFLIDDSLPHVIEALPGIERVYKDGKYKLIVYYGKAFDKEQVSRTIESKILEYLEY